MASPAFLSTTPSGRGVVQATQEMVFSSSVRRFGTSFGIGPNASMTVDVFDAGVFIEQIVAAGTEPASGDPRTSLRANTVEREPPPGGHFSNPHRV